MLGNFKSEVCRWFFPSFLLFIWGPLFVVYFNSEEDHINSSIIPDLDRAAQETGSDRYSVLSSGTNIKEHCLRGIRGKTTISSHVGFEYIDNTIQIRCMGNRSFHSCAGCWWRSCYPGEWIMWCDCGDVVTAGDLTHETCVSWLVNWNI